MEIDEKRRDGYRNPQCLLDICQKVRGHCMHLWPRGSPSGGWADMD